MRSIIALLPLLGLVQGSSSQGDCKCAPHDSCWPSIDTWNALNQSVSGKLIHNKPPAVSCYPGPLENAQQCAFVNSHWSSSAFRARQPAGYVYPTAVTCPPIKPSVDDVSGSCVLGPAPVYTINATEPEELATGIAFAKENNVRLVIRNTGHDMLGKSSGYGSLQIWIKYIKKGIEYQESYSASDQCTKSDWMGSAFTVAGGYIWEDVYPEAFKRNLTVVGGGDPSVGVIGGYTQGGGHSPASRDYGLAADQVLEAQVLLADGKTVTANACQNTDLFFAIRGGGGGTYGVVTSMTIKAHASKPVSAQSLAITPLGGDIGAFLDAVTDIYAAYPSLSDAGYSGYGTWSIASPVPLFGNATKGYTHAIAMMDKTMKEAQDAAEPLLNTLRKYNGTSLSVTVNWLEFPTYGAYYRTMSGVKQPAGNGNSALTSRMFDGPSLAQRPHTLRWMIGEVAGTEEQHTSNNLELVGGGEVLKPQPYSGVAPAWRSTYLVNIVARGWAPGADDSRVQAVQDDITYIKGGALRLQTPGMGSYMNEADRNDPLWAWDFYGTNYPRYLEIKDKYDPEDTFYCPLCVGSKDWFQYDLAGKDYGPLCPANIWVV